MSYTIKVLLNFYFFEVKFIFEVKMERSGAGVKLSGVKRSENILNCIRLYLSHIKSYYLMIYVIYKRFTIK